MTVTPSARLARGLAGHAWEQCLLPASLPGGELLWSPVHSGPLVWRNQVVTVHDVVPLDHPEWLNPRFAAWYRFMLPRLVRRARHVIAISEFTRQRLVESCGVSESAITVVPNGVNDRFSPADSETILHVRKRLGIDGRRYVLVLGSLEPRKNLRRLLEAWQQARSTLPDDVVLVVAGAPGERGVFGDAGLRRWPEGVMAPGAVADSDLPGLYSGAEWSLCVSLYEGFGLPSLESMACGTPVIASDIPVFDEVVGDAGLRVDPYNSLAISRELQRALGSSTLRDEMSARALSRSRAYSWRATAASTFEILNRYA